MQKPYHNLHRHYQAYFMLPYLQEYAHRGTGKPNPKTFGKDHRALHAHIVLQALGRRMTSPPDPDSKHVRNPESITDTCFPELETLCRDTSLSDSTVSIRASARLTRLQQRG